MCLCRAAAGCAAQPWTPNLKPCHVSAQGGCGARGAADARVGGSPAMLAVGLVWEAQAASGADIALLGGALQTSLQLGQIVPGAQPAAGPWAAQGLQATRQQVRGLLKPCKPVPGLPLARVASLLSKPVPIEIQGVFAR